MLMPPAPCEQQQNRLAYFLRDVAARTHALANTITSHVGDGVCNVCRACGTAISHVEWAERMFRAGISLVPFCSIRRNNLLSQLNCPAPRWGDTGGNAPSGMAVPLASSDQVGISDLSFAPSSSLSVELKCPRPTAI
jgi:hypothetical protein